MESAVAVANSADYLGRDLGHRQISRSSRRRVQDAVHGDECFPAGQLLRRENAVRGQAVMQTKGYEKGLSDNVPVRKPAFVALHTFNGAFGPGSFSARPPKRAAAATIGGPTQLRFCRRRTEHRLACC